MSNEGIVMSDRDFDKWFAKEFPEADLSNSEICKGYNNMKYGWEKALEHCKQGEALKNVKHEIGCDAIDMYSPDTDCTCGAEQKAKDLFAHAMPKSEPQPTTDISEFIGYLEAAINKPVQVSSDLTGSFKAAVLVSDLRALITKHTVKA